MRPERDARFASLAVSAAKVITVVTDWPLILIATNAPGITGSPSALRFALNTVLSWMNWTSLDASMVMPARSATRYRSP